MEDRETFASWVRQERDDLVRLAILVTADRAAAVRVTSTALGELGRDFRNVAETGVPETWARRRVVATAQELAISDAGLPADQSLAPSPDVGPALSRAWRVWAERLPGARACAALHVLDGLSIHDTAWTLGLTEAAVRSHLELMLIDVAGLAEHRGRDTEAKAKAEPVLREMMAGLVAGPMPVVEVPRFVDRRQLVVMVAAFVAVTALVLALLWWPTSGTRAGPAPEPSVSSTRPPLTRTSSTWSPAPTVPTPTTPRPGWRWVSTLGAAVQVPDSWVPTRRDDPWGWVELSNDGRTCLSDAMPVLTCIALAPSAVVVLTPWDPAEPDFPVPPGRVLTRRVGAVWLIVGVPDESQRGVAEGIVASAVLMSQDLVGCPVRHPAAIGDPLRRPNPAWDLDEVSSVTPVIVCRYSANPDAGQPTLLSSTRHVESEARVIVQAMTEAPLEGGRCLGSLAGERVVVIRLDTPDGPREVYGYAKGCQANHIDDGTLRREITPELCSLLGLAHEPTGTCG